MLSVVPDDDSARADVAAGLDEIVRRARGGCWPGPSSVTAR